MVKIFIGNLPDGGLVGNDDVRPLFEAYGTVTECEVIKNYGFVHMDSESASQEAIRNLNGQHEFHGRKMKVELSDNKGQGRKNTQKLFVGNIADGTTDAELRALFERYGRVVEADVMTDKNFGFVHVDAGMGRGKINDILRELHGAELNGNKLRVQLSTSGVRQEPGMGGDECFRCGGSGHWSKECGMQGGRDYDDYGSRNRRGGGAMRGGRRDDRRRDAPYSRGRSDWDNYGGYDDERVDYERGGGQSRYGTVWNHNVFNNGKGGSAYPATYSTGTSYSSVQGAGYQAASTGVYGAGVGTYSTGAVYSTGTGVPAYSTGAAIYTPGTAPPVTYSTGGAVYTTGLAAYNPSAPPPSTINYSSADRVLGGYSASSNGNTITLTEPAGWGKSFTTGSSAPAGAATLPEPVPTTGYSERRGDYGGYAGAGSGGSGRDNYSAAY